MKYVKLIKSAKQWIKKTIREAIDDYNKGIESDCQNCSLMADCADALPDYSENPETPQSVPKSAIQSPANCSAEDISKFVTMLVESGTVKGTIDGISNLVRRAEKLAFLRDNAGNLIGIAGLKHPRISYSTRIGAPSDCLEIGWFYVMPRYRNFTRAVWLITNLLKHVSRDVFFTTRNQTIAAIAKRVGFKVFNQNSDILMLHLDYAALRNLGRVKALYNRWVNS